MRGCVISMFSPRFISTSPLNLTSTLSTTHGQCHNKFPVENKGGDNSDGDEKVHRHSLLDVYTARISFAGVCHSGCFYYMRCRVYSRDSVPIGCACRNMSLWRTNAGDST